jgi:hypothetical protein
MTYTPRHLNQYAANTAFLGLYLQFAMAFVQRASSQCHLSGSEAGSGTDQITFMQMARSKVCRLTMVMR